MASLTGTSGNDTLVGTGDNDTIQGQAGNDSLDGGSGDDSLQGGAGNDTLHGGKGADRFDGGAGVDTADYSDAQDNVTVNLYTGTATDDWGNADTLTAVENVLGGAHEDTLTGDDADNLFEPGAGNDAVDGGGGFNVVSYAHLYSGKGGGGSGSGVLVDLTAGVAHDNGSGNQVGQDVLANIQGVIGSSSDDILNLALDSTGGTLDGRAGNDSLVGSDGNDTLTGGPGNDVIDGGNGVDTVSFLVDASLTDLPAVTQGAFVSLKSGIAFDNWGNGDTLKHIEVVIGSAMADTINGGDPNNDTFEAFQGEAGNDTIDGGSGFDVALYLDSPSAVKVTLGGTGNGTASDGFGGSDTLTSVEGVRGSANADTLQGSTTGTYEVFEGMAGNDSIKGGSGMGVASYEHSPAAVTVNLATGTASDGFGGTDTLTTVKGVIGSAYGDTITGGTADDSLVGGEGNDSIAGGDGNDTLYGGPGNDTLDGGAGNDTALFTGALADYTITSDPTTHELTVVGPRGTDTLRNMETLQFSDQSYTIVFGSGNVGGGTGSEAIFGGNTDDTITGGGGNDYLNGGDGNDHETTGDGNDTLDGGQGNDTMTGGGGNDTYLVDSSGDEVNETDNTGSLSFDKDGRVHDIGSNIDKVVASISYTLGNFVENLSLAGTQSLSGSGNSLANQIAGNAGNNILTGGGGDDHIDGGLGIDTASFTGSAAQYGLSQGDGGSFTVNGSATGEGTDTLSNLERLQFSDSNLAIDLAGNAGEVAKLLGAVFGPASVSDPVLVGIGLKFADTGLSYEQLADLAVKAQLGNVPSYQDVVTLLYKNVAGVEPDAGTRDTYVAKLTAGEYTIDSLTIFAADISYNLGNIGFTGLAAHGMAFIPAA